jgi:hypothetical protein
VKGSIEEIEMKTFELIQAACKQLDQSDGGGYFHYCQIFDDGSGAFMSMQTDRTVPSSDFTDEESLRDAAYRIIS